MAEHPEGVRNIINKFKRLCKNNSAGTAYIRTYFVIIFIFTVSVLGFEVFRVQQVSADVKNAIDNAVIYVSTGNAYNSFDGTREGGSQAVRSDGAVWKSSVDLGGVSDSIAKALQLTKNNSNYVRIASGKTQWYIKDIDITCKAPTVKDNDTPAKYYVSCKLVIPLIYDYVQPITINIQRQAKYVQRF